MPLPKLLLFVITIIVILSCHESRGKKQVIDNGRKDLVKTQAITICIQPFADLPASHLDYLVHALNKIYANITVNPSIPFPENSRNQTKTRYRADSLIHYLSRHTEDGNLTIGLTTRDISTTKGKYPDWGVMGLGYCPGKSCIASSFRLHGTNKLDKLYKVAIHELGHTQGLPHCPVKTCLMRDAEGRDHLDEEKEFCPKCRKVLIKAGWMLR